MAMTQKTKFYKNWWFWVICVMSILYITGFYLDKKEEQDVGGYADYRELIYGRDRWARMTEKEEPATGWTLTKAVGMIILYIMAALAIFNFAFDALSRIDDLEYQVEDLEEIAEESQEQIEELQEEIKQIQRNFDDDSWLLQYK